MEPGMMRSNGGMFFLPEGEALPRFLTAEEMRIHNAISYFPYPLEQTQNVPNAYVCRACGKLFMEFKKENQSQENG